MEDGTVVEPIIHVAQEVLDGNGRLVGNQLDDEVAQAGLELYSWISGCRPARRGFGVFGDQLSQQGGIVLEYFLLARGVVLAQAGVLDHDIALEPRLE